MSKFPGTTFPANIKRLESLCLKEVEDRYNRGMLSQDDYELYTYIWCNSCPRMSSWVDSWLDANYDPADPAESYRRFMKR